MEEEIIQLNDGRTNRRFEVIWYFSKEHGKVMPKLQEVEWAIAVTPDEALV